jgi:cytochrome c biogenesis protein CcmG, thiol:disulfide interchange protein DsbE
MRIGTIPWLAGAVLALGACAEDPPAKDPSTASSSSADSKSDDKAGGDKADKAADKSMPAAAGPGKTEVSCKGKPDVGKNASTFTLSSVNGGSKMSVEKGKVTIVDFWATWCEPCKKSFPKLQELFVKYKASGMDMIAVSEDDENTGITDFGSTFGTKFPLMWDDGKAIAAKWQPKSMPSTFIVDKKGVVRFVHLGYHDGEEAEIEKEVKSLL